MTIIEFFHEHYILAALVIVSVFQIVLTLLFRLPNRFMRHANILKHGWPPSHCDADGDFADSD